MSVPKDKPVEHLHNTNEHLTHEEILVKQKEGLKDFLQLIEDNPNELECGYIDEIIAELRGRKNDNS